jgi:hypothetical protein
MILLAVSVHASVVTSWMGGTLQAMPAINYNGPGPQVFGVGNAITWTSTNGTNQGGSLFGNTGPYSLPSPIDR